MSRLAWLYLAAEFGPTISFFVSSRFVSFIDAVCILMIATVLACILAWYTEKRLPVIPLMSALFVLIGGFITIFFKHPDAVIFADTLFYSLSAIILGVTIPRGYLIFKRLFSAVFAVTDKGWTILSWRWFGITLIAATANEITRVLATPEFWVDYRFYKSILLVSFAFWQLRLLGRHRIEGLANKYGLRKEPEK